MNIHWGAQKKSLDTARRDRSPVSYSLLYYVVGSCPRVCRAGDVLLRMSARLLSSANTYKVDVVVVLIT